MKRAEILEKSATILLRQATPDGYASSRKRLKTFRKDLNHRRPMSEEWFKTFLQAHKIPKYKKSNNFRGSYQNLVVGNSLIDFAFEKFGIAIEIDESSHSNATRQLKDQIKDEYLSNHGWVVCRIKYLDDRTATEVCERLANCYLMAKRYETETGLSFVEKGLCQSLFVYGAASQRKLQAQGSVRENDRQLAVKVAKWMKGLEPNT